MSLFLKTRWRQLTFSSGVFCLYLSSNFANGCQLPTTVKEMTIRALTVRKQILSKHCVERRLPLSQQQPQRMCSKRPRMLFTHLVEAHFRVHWQIKAVQVLVSYSNPKARTSIEISMLLLDPSRLSPYFVNEKPLGCFSFDRSIDFKEFADIVWPSGDVDHLSYD